MNEVFIDTEYITLGQFLKLADVIQTGGQVKHFLEENEVFVNDQKEDRRGKKIYTNDIIKIDNFASYVIKSNN